MNQRGFTLIEVVVALLLLSLTAVALVDSLLNAQRTQLVSGRRLQAVALAQDAIERARLDGSSGTDTVGVFRRQWTRGVADTALGLDRIDVRIEWNGPSPQVLRLATLVRR